MKKIILLMFLVVLLGACKTGKPFKGAEINLPASFKADLEEGLNPASDTLNILDLEKSGNAGLKWWEFFEDPLLDTLISTALKNNRSLLITSERLMQTRYALKIQNAEFLPRIGVQASGERGNFLFNQIGQVNELFIAGTGLNWEIDFWGRLRNLSEAARYEVLASEFGLRSLQLSLISDVAGTYFNWLQANAELEIAKRNLALRDSMHQIIVARFNEGIIQQTDVDQSNILKTIAAGAVPRFTRKTIQLENALNFLVGSNPSALQKSASIYQFNKAPDIDAFAPVDLLINRPDILQAEYQLMAQNSQVGAAKANRLPAISLQATLGIISDDIRDWDLSNPLWNLGGQIVGPLFFWGQLRRMVQIEESKEFQALFAYENTVLNALREVEDVKIEISTLKQELAVAEERKMSALNAQYLSGERYTQGVTSYLEVLESQRQAFDAELEMVRLKQALLSAYIMFYKVMGGGPLTENQ